MRQFVRGRDCDGADTEAEAQDSRVKAQEKESQSRLRYPYLYIYLFYILDISYAHWLNDNHTIADNINDTYDMFYQYTSDI